MWLLVHRPPRTEPHSQYIYLPQRLLSVTKHSLVLFDSNRKVCFETENPKQPSFKLGIQCAPQFVIFLIPSARSLLHKKERVGWVEDLFLFSGSLESDSHWTGKNSSSASRSGWMISFYLPVRKHHQLGNTPQCVHTLWETSAELRRTFFLFIFPTAMLIFLLPVC